jgi:hypothetical protein
LKSSTLIPEQLELMTDIDGTATHQRNTPSAKLLVRHLIHLIQLLFRLLANHRWQARHLRHLNPITLLSSTRLNPV